MLNDAGDVLLEQKVSTTPKAIKEMFGVMSGSRIALETGTHSPWVSRLLSELGHETIVAHARSVRLCDPILSMVCYKVCLILLHRLRQFLKIGLSELSRQEVCPAIRMHRILHHSLVVIR